MINRIYCLLFILFNVTQSFRAQVNYVRTWSAIAPEQNPNVLVTRPLSDVKMVTQFIDGIGRPIQTVAKQAG